MSPRTKSIKLLLASQSLRRKAILQFAGIAFKVVKPKGVQEVPGFGESAPAYTVRLALEKARLVARKHPGSWVLGADTIVVLDGKIIEKPENRIDAKRILMSLQGRNHEVMTAVALVGPDARKTVCHHEVTEVWFDPFSGDEIVTYLKSTEPYDKAGGYDVRGTAKKWVKSWKGDYFNILGLPLGWVQAQLRRIKS